VLELKGILMGLDAMLTCTHMVPAYFKSMNMIFKRFLEFEMPIPEKV